MPKLTEKQRLEMINEYVNNPKHTIKSVAKKYGVDNSSACTLFQRRGVKIRINRSFWQRKYSVNDNYFDEIDTEDKAYFLGLLYADGSINGNNIRLSLQEKDLDIIKKLKKYIQYTGPIKYIKSKNPKWQNQYLLNITNQKLSNSLKKLGCIQNKSLTLEFPTKVPKKLIRHFVRGYMDGDGYFVRYIDKKKNSFKYNANMVSTIMFLDKIKDTIKEKLNINCWISGPRKGKNPVTRQLMISGRRQCCKFLNWIYKHSNLYLQRKYLKYKEIQKFQLR